MELHRAILIHYNLGSGTPALHGTDTRNEIILSSARCGKEFLFIPVRFLFLCNTIYDNILALVQDLEPSLRTLG